ncbi:hypothetical protein PG993_000430 [Apiospora rasikravindrae]|uniref:Uncharacterized protein n=1 Tax=Apiospora rasikravindrae TaxID=990691 RepID=A0ABR1UBA2_9PEZI
MDAHYATGCYRERGYPLGPPLTTDVVRVAHRATRAPFRLDFFLFFFSIRQDHVQITPGQP